MSRQITLRQVTFVTLHIRDEPAPNLVTGIMLLSLLTQTIICYRFILFGYSVISTYTGFQFNSSFVWSRKAINTSLYLRL